jgi:hypothetical protein
MNLDKSHVLIRQNKLPLFDGSLISVYRTTTYWRHLVMSLLSLETLLERRTRSVWYAPIPAVPQPAVYQTVIPLRTKDASHPQYQTSNKSANIHFRHIGRNAHKTRDFTIH